MPLPTSDSIASIPIEGGFKAVIEEVKGQTITFEYSVMDGFHNSSMKKLVGKKVLFQWKVLE
jgi:hypothetical protein